MDRYRGALHRYGLARDAGGLCWDGGPVPRLRSGAPWDRSTAAPHAGREPRHRGGERLYRGLQPRHRYGKEYTRRVADPYEREVRRLAELIGSLVELSGRPLESVAIAAGLSPEGLSAILHGGERLEVGHLLGLAAALGVHPAELFLLAYPRTSSQGPTRDLLEKARAALKEQSGAAAATPDGPESHGRAGGEPG